MPKLQLLLYFPRNTLSFFPSVLLSDSIIPTVCKITCHKQEVIAVIQCNDDNIEERSGVLDFSASDDQLTFSDFEDKPLKIGWHFFTR